MTGKDRRFMALSVVTAVVLFLFVFWLGFPGYFQYRDIYDSLSVTTNHWHPVIIARSLQGLYFLFGRHSFYLFALNLFCFYAGTLLFVLALYLRTRETRWYLLFAVTAIGNLFFQNFAQLNNIGLAMLLWLGCSMVFFQILVPIAHARTCLMARGLTGIVFLLALLWRHNAILSVYPLFVLFIYLHLETKGIDKAKAYAFRFIALMIAAACALVLIVEVYPHLLSRNVSKTTANHIFLHQIAGMVVPANDRTFIPEEWYEKGKSFGDVAEMYAEYPTFADPFGVGWKPFDGNPILLFSLATSLSSCCTAIGVCIFCPATNTRYMSPVLVLSLIGLIGFSTWWVTLDKKLKLQEH